MEAGRLMSKTLPPKINLHEGREGRREKGSGGRERRRKGTSLSTGTEGKERLRFNGIKTAQFLEGLPARDRGGPCQSGKRISAVFFLGGGGVQAHRTGAGGFFAQMVFSRRKSAVQWFGKGDGTVQGCEISDESTGHVLLMGERLLSPGSDLSALEEFTGRWLRRLAVSQSPAVDLGHTLGKMHRKDTEDLRPWVGCDVRSGRDVSRIGGASGRRAE
ncbi:unnamed protein product [Pleuronectes platessa]|uniref:Uncharacterized protein n=1 Tax=Pleuronectes platessa TaxID=8262 RepID=A0A9N7TMQ3_PLEPL|nr:unnamed protein product [Pleuronectes platessa]